MTELELEALISGMTPAIKAYVAEELETLRARLEVVERCIADLEKARTKVLAEAE